MSEESLVSRVREMLGEGCTVGVIVEKLRGGQWTEASIRTTFHACKRQLIHLTQHHRYDFDKAPKTLHKNLTPRTYVRSDGVEMVELLAGSGHYMARETLERLRSFY